MLDLKKINPSNGQDLSRKSRLVKTRKSKTEHVQNFWVAPSEALFNQETVAAVFCLSTKTLECDRWRGTGIPYRKIGGRVLYRKADVIQWLEGHRLVNSTSDGQEAI